MSSPDTPTVLLPKTAFAEGSRAALGSIFERAGYDRVGDFDRRDEVEQGGLRFRAVKGPEAIATQLELFRGQTMAVISGTDILGEADLIARECNVSSNLERLLRLGIGPCSLRVLAPQEKPVESAADLSDRSIFTKYPRLLGELMKFWGISANIRPTLGADVRVNEFRDGEEGVAALEIVGSGDTARKSGLQIVENELMYPVVGVTDFSNIETNMYLTNKELITRRTRELLQELGLALESAKEDHQYVCFRFNVPAEIAGRFAGFGMKGPTASDLITADGTQWKALEVSVPRDQANGVRRELLLLGAQHLIQPPPSNVEVSGSESEVLRVLPGDAVPMPFAEEASDAGAVLTELQATIAQRAKSGGKSSTTRKLLEGDPEVLTARLVEEATEVARAVRKEGRERVIEESADLLYMLLVTLRGQDVRLEEVLQELQRRKR